MQLHQLRRIHPHRNKKRVGRGGTRGKTSGRGHKGQKQHGGTPRPQTRDMIKKIPKLRGHGKNRSRTVHSGREKPAVVNLATLEKHFESGETVSPETLAEKKLIRVQRRRKPHVKVLSQGALSKKLSFIGVSFSVSAKEKIEQAGSTIR